MLDDAVVSAFIMFQISRYLVFIISFLTSLYSIISLAFNRWRWNRSHFTWWTF